MANIAQYLQAIKTAVYGEEVRGSIHDAIDAINKEVITANSTANQAKQDVTAKIQEITELIDDTYQAKNDANSAAQRANNAAAPLENLTASATKLAAGKNPTATYSNGKFTFGIPKGDTGTTPAFKMGTVSTLNPNQQATATITGTAAAPVLNIGIPRGQSGTITNATANSIMYTESSSNTIYAEVEEVKSRAGEYKFTVEDEDDGTGHLYLHYLGSEAPRNFSINTEGHLICSFA